MIWAEGPILEEGLILIFFSFQRLGWLVFLVLVCVVRNGVMSLYSKVFL